MPEMVDDTNGEGYLHMYVKRKGPEVLGTCADWGAGLALGFGKA